MLQSINEIDFSKNSDLLDLYPLYQTSFKETDQKISTILKEHSDSPEFFNRYTQKDIPNILKLLSNLEKKYQEIQSSITKNFENNIEEYISNISKIILLLNLLYKNHLLITKAMTSLQTFLIKVSNENLPLQKFINHIKAFRYKHIQFMEARNNKTMINFRNVSRKTTKETTVKSNLNLAPQMFEMQKDSNVQTPKFSEQEKNIKDSDKKKQTSDSILSLSNMVFSNNNNNNNINNNNNPHNLSTQEIVPCVRKHKRNKTSILGNLSENQKELLLPKARNDKRRCSQLSCPDFDVIDKIKMYSELLELVNYMYKNCQINAEERVKIKQLIISKSKKIEDVYLSFGNKNIREDIKTFAMRLKEVI